MKTHREHLYLLDILKIMTLLAIAIFHAGEFIFYTNELIPSAKSAHVYHTLTYYARLFSLGGQILVSLIYFLFAYSGKTKRSLAGIGLFALFGQLILWVVFGDFEWDIYAYIAATNFFILAAPIFYKKNILTLGLALIPLLFPTDLYQRIFSDSSFFIILTGKMSDSNSGAWPLLPWFFLALLFYQLGLFAREHKESLKSLNKKELILWVLLIVFSLPFLGHYFWVPIGRNFYNFVFNQGPLLFWSNFLIFILMIRLSFLSHIQEKLSHSYLTQQISKLYWNRHTGLAYLLSIIYLGIGMRYSDNFERYPLFFDFFFIGIMPVSEMGARFFIFVVKLKK